MKKIRLSQNTFSFTGFTTAYVLAAVILTILYVRFLSTFSVRGGRTIKLVLLLLIFGGAGFALSMVRARNAVSILAGTLLPILIYEASTMWAYSAIVRRAIVIGSIAAPAAGFAWAAVRTRKITKEVLRRKLMTLKTANSARVLACLIFLAICIYGRYLIVTHYTISLNELLYTPTLEVNGVADYGNTMAANMETLAKLDPDRGWSDLSLEEKNEVLETVVRIECRYLGMKDSMPTLELAYLEEGLLGQYDYETDTITLSYNYMLSEAGGYSIVKVLCHELYHRYQHYLINFLEVIGSSTETEKYADLLYFSDLSVYREETENYIAPDGSESTYYLYKSQKLEKDAEKYGNASAVDYYEKIRRYLTGSGGET